MRKILVEEITRLRSRNKIFLGFIFLIIGGGIFLSIGKKEKSEKDKHLLKEKAFVSHLVFQAIPKISITFQRGDDDKVWRSRKIQCSDIPHEAQISDLYLNCNPHFFNCLLENRDKANLKFEVDHKGKSYEVVPLRAFGAEADPKFYRVVSKKYMQGDEIPFYGTQWRFTVKGFEENSQDVILQNTCEDTYLPQKVYISKEMSERNSEELVWNNIKQNIFIDKFQVRFRDIIDWKEVNKSIDHIKIPENPLRWAYPAYGLTVREMKEYCAYKGKSIAKAHILDAASFFPQEPNNPTYKDRGFPPYPWSKRKYSEDLYQIQSGKKEFNLGLCQNGFFKECFERGVNTKSHIEKSLSWIGVGDLLGGVMEYVVNDITPRKNLIASSLYLSASNPLNQLGMRIHWDQGGFSSRNIQFRETQVFDIKDDHKIGFRCMKILEGDFE